MRNSIRIVSTLNQKTKADEKQTKELVRVAKERFQMASEFETEIRLTAIEDIEFKIGEQWPKEVKDKRTKQGRPCLTINKIPQHIRQITNEQRQNRSSLKVSPVDSNADIQTAKIKQGLLRHIEYNSNADLAYDHAFDCAASGGFGYWRIVTDYVSPMSFDQELLIKPIDNQFTVYRDPNSKMIDGSDMNWCFVVTDMPKEDYKNEYGDSELAKIDDWKSIGDDKSWINQDSCRIAEYFYKTYEDIDIVLLSNGETIEKKELEKKSLPLNIVVKDERKAKKTIINWAIINGNEVLEQKKWPGSWIPIVPVFGGRVNINGKLHFESVIRYAKDSQRMYNYWASAETEMVSLAPKAPWIVSAEQIEGYEQIWETANTETYSYLPYNQFDSEGNQLSPPTRNVFEPPVQAISNARMIASEDIKSTTGINDASMGIRSNEQSGIAIQRRTIQAQTSNFHFIDNLNYSKKHSGRIMLELCDVVYDAPRTVRILGENNEEEIVRINEQFNDKNGQPKVYDFSSGKYDLTVDTGPSFATKRQETTASMVDLARVYPKILEVAGDLFVGNMDWNESKEIAERLKKTIPPDLVATNKPQQQIPPQLQAQLQQQNQMIEQLTQKLNIASENEKSKIPELQSKERIEYEKIQSNERIQAAKLEYEYLKLQTIQKPQLATDAVIKELAHINAVQETQQLNQFKNQNHELSEPPGFEQSENAQEFQQQNPTGGQSPGKPIGEMNDEQ